MNNRMPLILLMILLPLFGTACGSDEPAPELEAYEIKGRFLSTDMRGESISVVHETIPDVMNAMRMSLRIDNPMVAEGLETGDVIRFNMVRTEAGWYARDIEVLPPDTELNLPEELQDAGRSR